MKITLRQIAASGTRDATTFLRGDGSWAVPGGGGGGGSSTPDALRVSYSGITSSVIKYVLFNNNDSLAVYNGTTIQSGDAFYYDMWWEQSGAHISLDLEFSGTGTAGQTTLRDTSTETDTYGKTHPNVNVPAAVGAWVTRGPFTLTPWAGLTIARLTLACEYVSGETPSGGTPSARFRNARIQDSAGNHVLPILPNRFPKVPAWTHGAGTGTLNRLAIIAGS